MVVMAVEEQTMILDLDNYTREVGWGGGWFLLTGGGGGACCLLNIGGGGGSFLA
jgi:hypothetical protein